MQAKSFLLEVGCEELPPKSLSDLSASLVRGLAEEFQDQSLSFRDITPFATPRRLGVLVRDLSSTQPDQGNDRRGPALAAAFDDAGNPTKAALGFASSCGVSVEDLVQVSTEKGPYLVFKSTTPGRSAQALLPDLVNKVLNDLPLARRMRWGKTRQQFARPVRWVVMLYGDDVVSGDILGITAGRISKGHPYMAADDIVLDNPEAYVESLRHSYVIVSFDERKELIRKQLETEARKLHSRSSQVRAKPSREAGDVSVVVDESLLDEVTALVEWPVTLSGSFEAELLAMPEEVLVSAMKSHQRYFHLVDAESNLVAAFLTVANLESKNPDAVIAGNERVIRPRLKDAAFFFESDVRQTLASRVELLAGMTFQAELGSYKDKTSRVCNLAEFIANELNLNPEHARRAAELGKADLTTDMVGEFPELQGVMGYHYAISQDEAAEVAIAIKEQYLPTLSGGELPGSDIGKVLALADKLDTLVGLFGIGQPPTGSRDPYGLRRCALGVIRIIIECGLNLNLYQAIRKARAGYKNHGFKDKGFKDKGFKDSGFDSDGVIEYFLDRLSYWYQEQGYRRDIFAAVANSRRDMGNLLDVNQRILAVAQFKRTDAANALASANKRVANILRKENLAETANDIKVELFDDPCEHLLNDSIEASKQIVQSLISNGDYASALAELSHLQTPIDDFFDNVMVMHEDAQIRNNRIALLQTLRNLFLEIADISELQD